MRKWLPWAFCLLLLFVCGWWFWSLGALSEEQVKVVRLHIDQSPVSIKHPKDPLGAPSGVWEAAGDGEVIQAGDTIRTGEGGSATISFFGKGESRLGQNSEIYLEQIQAEGQADAYGNAFNIRVRLIAGRVWSRVLRLLDLDTSFDVQTDSVIATVRGTGFDVNATATGTTVWVSDAAVQIESASSTAPSESPFVLSEGFMASYDAFGKLVTSHAIDLDAKQTDWFIQNSNRDVAFIRQADDGFRTELTQMGSVHPDSWLDGVTKLSERFHAVSRSSEAADLYARYIVRRVAAMKQLIDEEKTGLALQAFSALQEDVANHLSGSSGETYRTQLKKRMELLTRLFEEEGPLSSAYRLKQRIEELRLNISGSDPSEIAYSRLLSIDARLDEAAVLVTRSSLDDAKNLLDTAREGIKNAEHDIDQLPESVSMARRSAIHAKLYGLKARETSIRTRLAAAIEPPANQGQAFPSVSTSTTSTIEELNGSSTSTSAVTSTGTFISVTLAAQPNPAFVGDNVRFVVKAQLTDGGVQDVTSKAVFSLFGNVGSLNGPTYAATAPGSITIQAAIEDGGKTWSATTDLQVKTVAPVLQAVRLMAPTTILAWDGTMPLTLEADYSDGTHKNVTASSQFSSSNTVLAYLTSNLLHAGSTASGVVRILGTYRENGIQKTSSLDLTIVSR